MAARSNIRDTYLDSDSDDEFFDALASDDTARTVSENADANNKGEIAGAQVGPIEEEGNLPVAQGNPHLTEDVQTESPPNVHPSAKESRNTSEGEGKYDDQKANETEKCSDGNIDVFEESEQGSSAVHAENRSERTPPRDTLQSSEHVHDDMGRETTDGEFDECLTTQEGETEETDGANMEDEEDEEAEEASKVAVDEDRVRQEKEDAMTEEERENLRDEAQSHKGRGNNLFQQNEFLDAVSAYTEALNICPLCYKKERSIMYANRGACRVRREQYEKAIEDCNKALELHPHYLKVWLRRANTYELMEKLDEALADFQKVLELDPACYEARAACMRLPDQIKERNEKLKEEMFGKLKELGNMVLRPFGLSTNNFQLQQDPTSGSYSVNFQQKPGNGS